MDITSIKEKYLVDINKNYVPKTAVEARLSPKSIIGREKEAQLRYRKELAKIKDRYDEAIRDAKKQYERDLKYAKHTLEREMDLKVYSAREWKSSSIGPKTPKGFKLAPTARLVSKNSKRINKERYT